MNFSSVRKQALAVVARPSQLNPNEKDTQVERVDTAEDVWICIHFPRIALDVFNPDYAIGRAHKL